MMRGGGLLRSLWPGGSRLAQEPGGEMFARLRRNLTFWYSAVLAGMLVLFGIILYFSVQGLLFSPVQKDAMRRADYYASQWDPTQLYYPCWQNRPEVGPAPGPSEPPLISNGEVVAVACFDKNGNLLQINDPDGANTPFVLNSLVSQALQSGTAIGTINDVNNGDLYTYAVAVSDQSGNVLGVVQVGESVSTQESVLNLLLILLLILGACTLIAAAVGGLMLAARALEPTRLAVARQQAFIADASHELRTPLTLMRADAEVLLSGRDRLDPDDALLLEDIVTEAGHMGVLANNMLTLARLDAGQYHLEREVIDLAEVATRAAHRARAFAREKQVTLHAEQMVPALVIGDRNMLEQATMILVDNAIKYNRAGGSVTLRAWPMQGQACLEVSDTGIGIAAEHLSHLGERFYRVDKARSREAGGAGLGLSIARGIATSHGGTLTLSSVAGQGTTARMLLPPADGASLQP